MKLITVKNWKAIICKVYIKLKYFYSNYGKWNRNQKIDRIICTSHEIIKYLKKLLQERWEQLKSIPLVVISERLQKQAEQEGFQHVMLAENASFEAIITTLKGDNTLW